MIDWRALVLVVGWLVVTAIVAVWRREGWRE